MQKNEPQGKVLVLGSVTRAMGARDILASHGIKSYLQRLKSSPEFGCGYGLLVPYDHHQAQLLLRQSGMKILSVLDP